MKSKTKILIITIVLILSTIVIKPEPAKAQFGPFAFQIILCHNPSCSATSKVGSYYHQMLIRVVETGEQKIVNPKFRGNIGPGPWFLFVFEELFTSPAEMEYSIFYGCNRVLRGRYNYNILNGPVTLIFEEVEQEDCQTYLPIMRKGQRSGPFLTE